MIIDQINDEIKFEEKLLLRYRKIVRDIKGGHLISQISNGSIQFYRAYKNGRKKYIRRGDSKLDDMYIKRYAKAAADILESNLRLLRKLYQDFRFYDMDSINSDLPKAYRDAYWYTTLKVPEPGEISYDKEGDVIQSENPFFREQLKHKVSNGLMVRSKNELLIAEMLLQFNIPFRYEKRLDLECVEINQYGQANYYIKTVYPDFTIFLPNDKVLYWEHEGGMEKPDYRRSNIDKLNCYFMNGILIPDKLIVTMDSETVPFDNNVILKIINDFILPKTDNSIIL